MSDTASEELIDSNHQQSDTSDLDADHTSRADRADRADREDRANSTKTLDELLETKDIRFKHLYNGMLDCEDKTGELHPVLEFKIDHKTMRSNIHDSNCHIVFRDVNFKCGWFYLDIAEKQLIGPLEFDATSYGDSEIRRVRFKSNKNDGEEMNWIKIINLSNDPSGLIECDDIPDWMYRGLVGSVGVKVVSDSDD